MGCAIEQNSVKPLEHEIEDFHATRYQNYGLMGFNTILFDRWVLTVSVGPSI
jgi:hypothetical protein